METPLTVLTAVDLAIHSGQSFKCISKHSFALKVTTNLHPTSTRSGSKGLVVCYYIQANQVGTSPDELEAPWKIQCPLINEQVFAICVSSIAQYKPMTEMS